MDKKEIISRIDFDNIQVKSIEQIEGIPESIIEYDYLVDYEGNFILPLTPLDMKFIEIIKDLEARIQVLELKK